MATFQDDEHALQVTRNKINEEYRKYKNVTNSAAIEELNKFAEEVEHELRTTFYVLALRLTPDKLVDSIPYKDEKCDTSNKNADINTSISKDKPNLE
ncbi:hypothetical protein E2986_00205 [Frieseomelitta varia]|uniref:Uncharacterized protein n=1 Tax=Frieseomelitta varia TaxID=561572 RepID=A0A833W2K0_9HYME|nr:hypothetical protein E2986_00205 [Frieseomelitta varia]